MSSGITRLGDLSTGHGSFAPRISDSASTDVFVNGIGAVRVGDHWAVHCDSNGCHDGVQATGSSTVFVNGLAVARIGDSISCGDTVAIGSTDVFAG